MVSLTRASDQAHEAAGAVAVTERTRTLALALSTVVPFIAGLLFFAWAVWAYHDQPPLASSVPFGGRRRRMGLCGASSPSARSPASAVRSWASWSPGGYPFRGAGIVSAVLLIMAMIVFQGIVEPVRYVREFMPWTYFWWSLRIRG